MYPFSKTSPRRGRGIRTPLIAAVIAALVWPAAGAVLAQGPGEVVPQAESPLVEFTVDVAEELNGKFVPTFVKPEHTQPERGSFFLTQGRVFPGLTVGQQCAAVRTRPAGQGPDRHRRCRKVRARLHVS